MRIEEPEYQARFGGIVRLLGAENAEKLRSAAFCIVGVGGVGSWAAEALARSGVGGITLVDLDDVCITNTNRQLPAVEGQIGRPKVRVLAERIRAIDPGCQVATEVQFYTAETAPHLLAPEFSCVIDAIDGVSNKCRLLADCVARGLPVVTTGGAGGKSEPARVKVGDLAVTGGDNLLRHIRKRLRTQHGFPRKGAFGIPCIYSDELPVQPWDEEGGCPTTEGTRLDCAGGLGAATFVTGTFGFFVAREAIRLALR